MISNHYEHIEDCQKWVLGMWMTAGYAQVSNSAEKNSTAADKEKLAAIEKACQKIIDENDYKYLNNNSSDSLLVSYGDLIKVLGDVSSELQKNKNTKQETAESKNQLHTAQPFNNFYSKEKYEALIAHGDSFIKKTEFLSQTLHTKGKDLEAALKMNAAAEEKAVVKKMGEAFHTMGFRLDAAILDLKKTQPYIVEAYNGAMAVSNEATSVENLHSSINVTKSLQGVLLYLAAIKNCNTTVSKVQEDLAFLGSVSRAQKKIIGEKGKGFRRNS